MEQLYLTEYNERPSLYSSLQVETDPELIKIRNTALIVGFLAGAIITAVYYKSK